MVPLTSAGNLNGRTEEEKQSRNEKKKLKQNEEIEKSMAKAWEEKRRMRN